MKIVICEDEHAIAEQITKLVQGWASFHGQAVHITHFKSAEAFLFAYEDDKSMDLILLDIQMGEMNGMALARKIRENNDRVQIIFITGISDYAAEGYDVSAVHYLLKPVKVEKLYAALDKVSANLSKPKRTISIDTADGITLVVVDDIVFIEALGHELAITTKEGTINCRMPLYKLEEVLSDERFIKIHRSYLVNMVHIKRVTRTDVILDNGIALPLSRRLYKDINGALMKYVIGGMS